MAQTKGRVTMGNAAGKRGGAGRMNKEVDACAKSPSRVSAGEKLFMDFIAQDYLPHVRQVLEPATAWSEEVRATALVWEFGGLALASITSGKVEAFKIRTAEKCPLATANLYLALAKRIFSKAVEWGYLAENPSARVLEFRPEAVAVAV